MVKLPIYASWLFRNSQAHCTDYRCSRISFAAPSMETQSDDNSLAAELGAVSRIHPANDPTRYLDPLGGSDTVDIAHSQHHDATTTMTDSSPWTAPITLVMASLIMLCAVAAIGRIGHQLWRDEDQQGRRIRRLRGTLVIGLLTSDFIVA